MGRFDFEKRRNELRARCRSKKIDGFLSFNTADVYYLSGYNSEGCAALVSKAGDFVFSPPLLAEHVRNTVRNDPGITVLEERFVSLAVKNTLKKHSLKRIGFDPSSISHSLYLSLAKITGVRWNPLDGFLMLQRVFKDAEEIKAITEACRVSANAARTALKNLHSGQTELAVAQALENDFRAGGSFKTAFDTIVAFGPSSAYPHHITSMAKITPNSAVLMDLGCRIRGYCSDLTRSAFFGRIPDDFRKIFRVVKTAQEAGIHAIRDGISAEKADAASRDIIRKAGYGGQFTHSTGHGVGIDIHEPPRLGPGAKGILREGMVVTVEPGIYLPGRFGVRIEDTVLITKGGCKVLTRTGKIDTHS